jgi:hypothetical protein
LRGEGGLKKKERRILFGYIPNIKKVSIVGVNELILKTQVQ